MEVRCLNVRHGGASVSIRCRQLRACARVTLAIVIAQAWLMGAAQGSTLVSFNTTLGAVQVDLFDNLTPATVNNFLQYVNSNAYQNVAIHRSIPGFVVQGGGYQGPPLASFQFNHITTLPSPVNEFNHTNARGTIAMAKQPSDPNSATSEWFFNVADNKGTPPNGLDYQNGGFTVFGWVVSGMSVVDAIAALPRFNFGSGLDSVPLQNYTSQDAQNNVPLSASNIVMTNSITVVKTHAAYQNPVLTSDINNDGNVNANDAARVINDLLVNGTHNLTDAFGGTNSSYYIDVNGDGKLNARDAAQVIQALLLGGSASQSALVADPQVAPLVVPEPSSLVLAALAAAAVGGLAWRRRSGRMRAAG